MNWHQRGLSITWAEVELDEHKDKLKTGANVLAIHGLNATLRGSDFLLAVELNVADYQNVRLDIID